MSGFLIPNLITLLLSFLVSIDTHPPVSRDVPFVYEDQEMACMQAVNDPSFYISIKNVGWNPNPHPLIDIVGKATLIKKGKTDHIESFRYTMKNVNIRCPGSFVYSDANREFDNIKFEFDFYNGYQNRHKMASFGITVHPNIQHRWMKFNDTLNRIEMYTYFQPGLPTVVPISQPATASQAASAVDESKFNSEYICLGTRGDPSGIKVNFSSRARMFPKYKAVVAHVYDGERPVRVERVDAWPCPEGEELHRYRRPTLVVDSGLNNVGVIWTFKPIDSDVQQRNVPLSVLQTGNYFETDCRVRFLSEERDWVSWNHYIFAVETERHTVLDVFNQEFTRIRSVDGHRPLVLLRHYTQDFSSLGLSNEVRSKKYSYRECQPISDETPIDSE